MSAHLTAFVLAQLADLLTWTLMGAAAEANPLVSGAVGTSLGAAAIAKGSLIVLGCSITALLLARRRYRPVAELLLAVGIFAGAFGAGTNWANAAAPRPAPVIPVGVEVLADRDQGRTEAPLERGQRRLEPSIGTQP